MPNQTKPSISSTICNTRTTGPAQSKLTPNIPPNLITMSPNPFSHGGPLSPDYGADDQGDLIWIPIRVPKGSSHSPPTNNQNFYQHPDRMNMQGASDPYFPPVSWGQDTTMTSTTGSYSGISASEPTMDWSSSELPVGGEFDAALALELQEYLDNQQVAPLGLGEQADLMSHSPSLFSGMEGSDPFLELPDFGLGLTISDTFGSEYNSPVGAAWGTFDHLYSPAPSGSCSPPATSSSPATAGTPFIPPTPVSPALFMCPDAPYMLHSPTTCHTTTHHSHQTTSTHPSRRRHNRASPTSPREINTSTSGGSFHCSVCDKPHLDNRALSRHLWAQHPDFAARTKTRSERAQCPHCDYSGRADNLARHMKRHSK